MDKINELLVFNTGGDDAWYEYGVLYYDKSSGNLICVPDSSNQRFVLDKNAVLVFDSLEKINLLDIKLR